MKKRIYISGKIGYPILPDVRQKFNCAAQQLAAAGFEPVNPFDNGLSDDDPWIDHILADMETISQCEGIYRLPDWTESDGARIERWVARRLFPEKAIIEQPHHMAFNPDNDATK